MKPTLLVLLTCHNRRDSTLDCLRALEVSARGLSELQIKVVLVDAGSADGTAEAIRREFPDARIVPASSDVFWTAGMRMAWAAAQDIPHDLVLWLNDDLSIEPGALAALYDEYCEHLRHDRRVIVVGRVVDPASGRTICGGHIRRSRLSCFAWETPQAGGERCHTFGGNCVLMPEVAFTEVGNLSEAYQHSLGDMDYGLRAARANYAIYQSTRVVGFQTENKQVYSVGSVRLTMSSIRKVLKNPKGLPPKELLHFCRSHGSFLWPADFVLRYLRAFNLIPSPFQTHGR